MIQYDIKIFFYQKQDLENISSFQRVLKVLKIFKYTQLIHCWIAVDDFEIAKLLNVSELIKWFKYYFIPSNQTIKPTYQNENISSFPNFFLISEFLSHFRISFSFPNFLLISEFLPHFQISFSFMNFFLNSDLSKCPLCSKLQRQFLFWWITRRRKCEVIVVPEISFGSQKVKKVGQDSRSETEDYLTLIRIFKKQFQREIWVRLTLLLLTSSLFSLSNWCDEMWTSGVRCI